jgi:hypothetical protein
MNYLPILCSPMKIYIISRQQFFSLFFYLISAAGSCLIFLSLVSYFVIFFIMDILFVFVFFCFFCPYLCQVFHFSVSPNLFCYVFSHISIQQLSRLSKLRPILFDSLNYQSYWSVFERFVAFTYMTFLFLPTWKTNHFEFVAPRMTQKYIKIQWHIPCKYNHSYCRLKRAPTVMLL